MDILGWLISRLPSDNVITSILIQIILLLFIIISILVVIILLNKIRHIYYKIKNNISFLREKDICNEKHYCSIVSSLTEGIILYTTKGEVITFNQAAKEILGLSETQILQHNCFTNWQAISVEGKPFSIEKHPVKQAIQTLSSGHGIIVGVYKDSHDLVWLKLNIEPIFNKAHDQVEAVVTSFSNITQQKLIEEASQFLANYLSGFSSQAFFEELVLYLTKTLGVDFAFIGKYMEQEERMSVLAFCKDDKIENTFIYSLKNTPCENIILKGDIAFYLDDVDALFVDDSYLSDNKIKSYIGIPLWSSSGHSLGGLIVMHRHPLKSVQPIKAILGVFATSVANEIEHLETRKALQESQQRYQLIVESANEGIWLFDEEDNSSFINRKMLEILGYSSIDMLQDYHLTDFIADRLLSEDNVLHKQEFRIVRQDNSQRWVLVDINPLFSNNEYAGSLVIVHDITERRIREQQLLQAQKMETIGQLTGGISHDFNNLLTIIMGNLTLLSQEHYHSEEDQKEIIQDALSAAKDGSELVKRLLSFSRTSMIKPSYVKVNDVISDFVRMLARSLGKDINLNILLQKDLNYIYIDQGQLESALLNLAVNARDAMPQGGKLTIRTAREEKGSKHNNKYIAISIQDNGIGMTPEVLAKVTEPFFTTKELGKGSGLGLTMVYNFVKNAEGDITIESVLDRGTIVTLFLPETAEKDRAVLEKSQNTTIDYSLSLPNDTTLDKILVVEDEPALRRLAIYILKNLGYAILEAGTVKEAMDIIIQEHDTIKLVFSDIIMPGGQDGYELAFWLREYYPEIKILLTSGFDKQKLSHLTEQPFLMLSKPYTPQELRQSLQMILADDNIYH